MATTPSASPTTTPSASPTRLVRVLVVVVAIECAVALATGSGGLWEVASDRAQPADYLAVAGVAWVAVLAVCGLLVARRLEELGRRVEVQDEHLAAAEVPRRRLAAITYRTEALLAAPAGLQIALQPIVDLTTGRWSAVEALSRFPDNAPPDRWFAEAHETGGLGVRLELLALTRALDVLPVLPPDVQLSANASPQLVLDPAFHELLDRCGSHRERLTVEITEHAAVTGYEDIRAALLPHRERGLRLAVDDTGAGYSSFAHVLRLRPDVVKLDRSLLADIDHDAARRAFVTAIVLMALELEAAVTAEGVETAAELDTLRTLGVDTVQGYLLARPSTDPAAWQAWARRDWMRHAGLRTERHPQGRGVTYG